MISILTNKHNLVALGFYNAFKTLYKTVHLITYPVDYRLIKDSKIVIINDFTKLAFITFQKDMIVLLLKKNENYEKKLISENIKYYNIEEYSNDKIYEDYIKKERFMYIKENQIIMPYFSIYTKSVILLNYKNNLLKKKIEEFDHNNIIIFKNHKRGMIKSLKIKKLKRFTCLNKHQEEKLIKDNNIIQSFSDINKFDTKSITYMSLGSISMTNSVLTKKHIKNTILNGDIKDIVYFNIERKHNIIENIQEIYNNYTFEKYVIILNKLL